MKKNPKPVRDDRVSRDELVLQSDAKYILISFFFEHDVPLWSDIFYEVSGFAV